MKRIDVIERPGKANHLRTGGAGLIEMSKDEKRKAEVSESVRPRVEGFGECGPARHLGFVKGEH